METKKFKQYQSRYEEVLKAVQKEKLWTLTEIQRELENQKPKVEMTIQGVKKNLNLMELNHEVVYMNFERSIKKLSQKTFQKKFRKKINKYYLATPKSAKLFKILFEKVKPLNIEKYMLLIEEVIDHYANIEVGAIFMKKRFADEKLIHSAIKEKKKSKKVLQKEIDYLKNNIESYLIKHRKFKEVKLRLPVNKITVKGIEYFLVNDELVPISKLMGFMKLLEFDIFMKLVAYAKDPWEDNRKNAVIPAIKAMKDLFVEIVKDSQIKI